MKEALYIILGWLFGLLSPRIIQLIETPYKRKNFKKAIFSDLKNLAVRLTALCSRIEMHFGTRTKDSLKWQKDIYGRYKKDCSSDVLDVIEKLLISDDIQFQRATILLSDEENISLGLKKYSLSFIESTLECLSMFGPGFQGEILEICEQLNMLNQEIESSIFFYKLTFDSSCMKINGDIVRKNLKNTYERIQSGSKIIVNKICDILENSQPAL